ncbi:MAG: prepilin peptidase [Ruminococcaceae bacterium]|nr:prepilin peptidase [Oscillospiraceae bacterium]
MTFTELGRTLMIYSGVLAVILGACMGSFLNCTAWRIARDEDFTKGRSRCPKCGHDLGALDLVPVLSWVFLRGRCRYCGEKVSVRYPLTELLCAALTLACLLRFGFTIIAARNLVFLMCLFCLSLVDLDVQIIPDGCLIIAALAWLAAAPFSGAGWGDVLRCVGAGLVFGGGILCVSLVMDKILQKDTLGGGDIKLLAVVGLYLGFVGTLMALLLACVLGLLLAAAMKKKAGQAFPFGPAIAAAAALVLLYGGGVIRWYLGLLGY